MKLLVFTLFVTYVTAVSQLGSKKCAWGPSYWCSHVNHAKECSAVDHCMTTVWKNQIIKPKSTSECLYCQMGFNELKDLLQNKAIQEDISKYVSDICTFLPDPDWKSTCNGIVTEDLPIIIEMLDNKINSDMICAAVGICSGLEDTYSPYGALAKNTVKLTTTSPPNTTCADCTKFFQDLQMMITSKETQNELEQLLNQVICSKIPSLTSICNESVKELLPMALQFLAEQLDPNIACRVFGFCVNSYHSDIIHIKNIFKDLKQPLKLGSSEECEVCKDLVSELDNILRDKSTQDAIKTDLESYVCNSLGGLAGTCKQVVEEYLPNLFELLVNELNPNTTCESIGMCTVRSGSRTMPAAPLVPAVSISNGYKANTVECELCEFAMQGVQSYLEENGTVESIEEYINMICKKLTSDVLTQQCLAFVQQYGKMVIELIKKDLDPKLVCTELNLCKAKLNKMLLRQKSNAECDICIFFVNFAETFLTNVSTDSIVNEVEAVCTFLPGNLSDTCLKYVKLYLPIAIEILKEKEDAKQLCKLGGLCNSTYSFLHKPYMTKPIPEDISQEAKEDKVTASVTCEICDTALVYLKALVGNNATESEIEAALENLCSKLPSTLTSECQSLVKEYGQAIIAALLNNLDPHAACIEIGLCSATIRQVLGAQAGILSPVDTLPIVADESVEVSGPVQTHDTKEDKVKASVTCEVCDTVLIYLKSILGDNATESEIEAALENLCSKLPSTLTSECQSLVKEYGQAIIAALLNNLDPHAACIEIGLCSGTIRQVLGAQAGILSPVDTLPIVADESVEDPVQTHDTKEDKVKASVTCEVCDTFLIYLKSILGDNATESEIEAALENLCSDLPSTLTSECQSLVKEYGQAIIAALLNNLDPHAACIEIGLCSATIRQVLGAQAGILSPVDTLPIVADESVKVQVPAPNTNDNKVKASVLCEVCDTAIIYLKSILENNATEDKIKKELESLCNDCPSKESCLNIIDTYGEEIIKLLLSDADPNTICTAIGLCSSTVNKVVQVQAGVLSPLDTLPIFTDENKKESNKFRGAVECDACMLVMEAADKGLQEKKTQEAIKDVMIKACELLTKEFQSECVVMVNTYYKVIVNYLILSESPKAICKKLEMCPAQKKPVSPIQLKLSKVAKPVGASIGECLLCKMVINKLEGLLKANKSEAEITQYLENDVCPFFTASLSTECETFVAKYSSLIIRLLVNNIKPDQVCQKLQLCTVDKVMGLSTLVKILPAKVSFGYCEPCRLIMTELKKYLTENRTAAEVEKFLDRMCDILPDTVTAQCEDVVKEDVPAILALLKQDLTPTQICQKLNLCKAMGDYKLLKGNPSGATDDTLYFHSKDKLLGSKECTYGPAYWCANKENAKKCKAVDHCEKHVWN